MSYNLLLDTDLKGSSWQFINCKYEDGYLVSNDKVFGIMQELILPDVTKLYFRWNYTVENYCIKEVKIGIQNGNILEINKQYPRFNKSRKISLIDYAKQEKVKLHLIFESDIRVNKVAISEPLLCDLNYLGKSTWLKSILDRVIKFRHGYSYTNIYKESEFTLKNIDLDKANKEQAKIGLIVSEKNKLDINLNAKLSRGEYYLAKLDYQEINNLGNVYFKYKEHKSSNVQDEQCFILFKYDGENKLQLVIEPNDIIDYKINLKHIMIINITKMKLLKGDILYLPFI